HALGVGNDTDAAQARVDAAQPVDFGLCNPALVSSGGVPAQSDQTLTVNGTAQEFCFGVDATQLANPYFIIGTSVVAGAGSGFVLLLHDAAGAALGQGGDLTLGDDPPGTSARVFWGPPRDRRNVYASLRTADGASRTTVLSAVLGDAFEE